MDGLWSNDSDDGWYTAVHFLYAPLVRVVGVDVPAQQHVGNTIPCLVPQEITRKCRVRRLDVEICPHVSSISSLRRGGCQTPTNNRHRNQVTPHFFVVYMCVVAQKKIGLFCRRLHGITPTGRARWRWWRHIAGIQCAHSIVFLRELRSQTDVTLRSVSAIPRTIAFACITRASVPRVHVAYFTKDTILLMTPVGVTHSLVLSGIRVVHTTLRYVIAKPFAIGRMRVAVRIPRIHSRPGLDAAFRRRGCDDACRNKFGEDRHVCYY